MFNSLRCSCVRTGIQQHPTLIHQEAAWQVMAGTLQGDPRIPCPSVFVALKPGHAPSPSYFMWSYSSNPRLHECRQIFYQHPWATNLQCLSHSTCDILLWQPERANRHLTLLCVLQSSIMLSKFIFFQRSYFNTENTHGSWTRTKNLRA